MADMPTGFWAGWIAVITIVTLIGLVWLVWSVYFAANGADTEEVWDETLREGTAPAPLWWFWFILALLAVTVVYLILYPGLGANRGVLRWSQGGRIAASVARYEEEFGARRAELAHADAAALRGDALALSAGASVFQNHCAACHGVDGAGQADLFPNLTDASWQWGSDARSIEQTVTAGRQAVMPPWQAVLNDAGVAQVTDYVLALSEGSAGSALSAGSIASADTASDGRRAFQTYCSACHGPDGAGQPLLGAPALNDDAWLYGGTREAVRASIAEGRNGVMPAFGGRLDAAQIKLVVAWLGRDAEHVR
jgi:cytochrome c oxidase cbb3-type subunit 3